MSIEVADDLPPERMTGVLGREEIVRRIRSARPLLVGLLDEGRQVQPNGVDLSLRAIARFEGVGTLAADNAGRELPSTMAIPFAEDGFTTLAPGPYQVIFNEVVDLPNDLMALGRPRSSLCRCGVLLHTAVWDAGYRGRSTALLVVANPLGFRIERAARLLQLVFLLLAAPTADGYSGQYQREHLAEN